MQCLFAGIQETFGSSFTVADGYACERNNCMHCMHGHHNTPTHTHTQD